MPAAARSARSAPPTAAPPGVPPCWSPASATTPWPARYGSPRCPRPTSTAPAPSTCLGRLPVPLRVHQQRHRDGQVHQRHHMGGTGPGADRRRHPAPGPLRPRHRRRPRHLRRQRPHRADLLLLSERVLLLFDLQARRRVHLLGQRRRTWSAAPRSPGRCRCPGCRTPPRAACSATTSPPHRGGRQRLSGHSRLQAPAGSTFHQAMYVPAGGLAVTGGSRAASAAHSHRFTPQPAPTLPVTAH